MTENTRVQLEPKMPASWRKETKAHKFCPGCGHGLVLKALGEVIDELGIQDRVVFVCDIGCCLLAWDFFNCDSIQTHHGRATPVAAGVKRARKDAITIAYMGDGGGYAIGSGHLVNAAARNERMMVLLANNTNYAMTGGQMAPTTLIGQKTETSPFGRTIEEHGEPTRGVEMVAAIASNGAYVARGTTAKLPVLKRYIKKALEVQMAGTGFSFVEALAGCPTNWKTNAKETWEFLEKDMAEYFVPGEYVVPEEGQK